MTKWPKVHCEVCLQDVGKVSSLVQTIEGARKPSVGGGSSRPLTTMRSTRRPPPHLPRSRRTTRLKPRTKVVPEVHPLPPYGPLDFSHSTFPETRGRDPDIPWK